MLSRTSRDDRKVTSKLSSARLEALAPVPSSVCQETSSLFTRRGRDNKMPHSNSELHSSAHACLRCTTLPHLAADQYDRIDEFERSLGWSNLESLFLKEGLH